MTGPRATPAPTRPLAVVTGASSGLGLEIARYLASLGWDLVISARSAAALELLREEVAADFGATAIVAPRDLALPTGVAGLVADVAALQRPVGMLVANAGFGLYGPYLDTDPEGEREMLEVNMAAPVALVRALLPAMVARGEGRLLIVASVGAFLPGPYTATYYATRAFSLSYAEALAQEMVGTGVTVTCLCPGPMPTGFQARAGMSAEAAKVGAVSPDRVARRGVDGALAGRRRVVPGLLAKGVPLLARLLPRTLLARLTARVQAGRGRPAE